MHKDNRRIKKTKRELLAGLTTLMEQKSLKDISVRELAETVDINRGTFYLHYKDIFDMLEQVEQELFEEFHEIMEKYPLDQLKGSPLLILMDLFQFLYDNASLCKVLLGKNGDIAFVEKLKGIVKNHCLNAWTQLFNASNVNTFEYFHSFIVSGIIGLFQKWLENGMVDTPQQMAKLSEQMIMQGMKVLE